MQDPIETLTSNDDSGIRAHVYYADCPYDPREEFDHLGRMVCWHSRYKLGDEQPRQDPAAWMACLLDEPSCPHCEGTGELACDPENPDEIPAECPHCDGLGRVTADDDLYEIMQKDYFVFPLYLYDHSGLALQMAPFTCPWDSCQVGFIYMSKSRAAKEFALHESSPQLLKAVEHYFEGEVKEYSDYLNGEVFGYVVEDENGEILDSCGGYYGLNFAIKEAQDALNSAVAQDEKARKDSYVI